MKKILSLGLLILMLFNLNVSVAASTIPIYLDDVKLPLSTPPVIVSGVTIVPVADILKPLGADIDWNASTKTVTAIKGDTEIIITIGSSTAKVNGKSIALATPAKIINGKTMIPLKFVSESLGYNVTWDGVNREIYIDSRVPQGVKYYTEGMFKVGTDLEVGVYKLIAGDFAYVESAKDSKGEFESINWNGTYKNIGYFEVKESDAYITVNNGKFFKFDIDNAKPAYKDSYTDGIYLVGIDIEPGEYKVEVEEGDMGYVQRSSDINGDLDSIIMNDLYKGSAYIEILSTDTSVKISGCTLVPIK